jgi:hypothetical protein
VIGAKFREGAWPEESKNSLSARLLKLFPIPKRDFASFSELGRAATLDPGSLTLRAADLLVVVVVRGGGWFGNQSFPS